MHMADALVSPAVGGAMLATSAVLIGISARKVRENFDNSKIPLMGVMGAFVFAMQMINFTIPATGSSGHIGGGMMLAALLGSYPAFLVISAVLIIQALFFADGGLLALGANIFNMGFWTCFIAYPLVFLPIAKDFSSRKRIVLASVASSIVGLQFGSFCVVLETLCSGVTELPFGVFAGLMLPIHFAIGAVEGVLTAMLILFLKEARPELFNAENSGRSLSFKAVCGYLALASFVIAGAISLLASEYPDGLEWSIGKITKGEELSAGGKIYEAFSLIQTKLSVFADYAVQGLGGTASSVIAGIAGVLIVALFIVLYANFLRKRHCER
ncbi:energy-coupling factor ABC transporter permease [Intestinicryptomonas porci]|uniref:Energy-coupling factor ABC transporter permease n=1 Tax=Intestinicryptomonas porci TaxID=2926320 RepID=A0ABU4WG22_9BACT|nr:energy-coupling factor ABC transporter permease [Opitutales bacterium CLA-KB-P66]